MIGDTYEDDATSPNAWNSQDTVNNHPEPTTEDQAVAYMCKACSQQQDLIKEVDALRKRIRAVDHNIQANFSILMNKGLITPNKAYVTPLGVYCYMATRDGDDGRSFFVPANMVTTMGKNAKM